MYTFNKCSFPGCNKTALSSFNEQGEIIDKPGYCFEHTEMPEQMLSNMRNYILSHEKIVGLNANGITIDNIDLTNKKLYGCNLQNCTMRSIHANGLRARMCMMDFCTFSDCDLLNSNIQFSSFSGSRLVHILFTGSDLIHNNFNGITAYQSSFDDSDLYNSRFIKAMLINTSLNNCNLKKTVFYECIREGVGFKLSNTRESLVDRNRGGLMGDINTNLEDDDIETLNTDEYSEGKSL